MAAASTTRGLGLASNTVRSSSVTLPLVGDKVWQVVLQDHAGGGGVAPVYQGLGGASLLMIYGSIGVVLVHRW